MATAAIHDAHHYHGRVTMSNLQRRRSGGRAFLINARHRRPLSPREPHRQQDIRARGCPVSPGYLPAPVLFLAGLPATRVTQPETVRSGQIGLGLMGLAAAISPWN